MIEPKSNQAKMLWHYAPWAYLPRMVESGVLKASNVGASGESPLLWFSANQHWEPTACKVTVLKTGALMRLTFRQQQEAFGCIRFGLLESDPRLLNWIEACTAAGTLTATRRLLERKGKKQGGDPNDWFATVSNIPIDELHFQVWGINCWMNATSPKDMAEVWTKVRG